MASCRVCGLLPSALASCGHRPLAVLVGVDKTAGDCPSHADFYGTGRPKADVIGA